MPQLGKKKMITSLILGLLILAGPVAAALVTQQRVVTGDSLLDAYSTAIKDHSINSVGIQTDLMAQEDQFADDPRYWQLLALMETPELRKVATESMYTNTDVLSGIERGAYTPATFVLLNLHSVADDNPQKAIDLADQAIEADPHNALFYYRKAELLAKLERFEEATATADEGNKKPNINQPLPFPLSHSLQSNYVPRVIPYLDAGLSWRFDHSENIARKDVHRAVIDEVSRGNLPSSALDTFYSMAVREAMATNAVVMDALMSNAILSFYLDPSAIALAPGASQSTHKRNLQAISSKIRTKLTASPHATASWSLKLRRLFNKDAEDWKANWEDMVQERPFVQSLKPDYELMLPSPFATDTPGSSR
jgi:tetratricopeptide (TPR) repeat protein